jgi:hypothetical protein
MSNTCLYCGWKLSFFMKLRGHSFCSPEHNVLYFREERRLAYGRLNGIGDLPSSDEYSITPTSAIRTTLGRTIRLWSISGAWIRRRLDFNAAHSVIQQSIDGIDAAHGTSSTGI